MAEHFERAFFKESSISINNKERILTSSKKTPPYNRKIGLSYKPFAQETKVGFVLKNKMTRKVHRVYLTLLRGTKEGHKTLPAHCFPALLKFLSRLVILQIVRL
ncbi:unnamed protein product [Nippostrongylus brasiliensis]|uniref:60S ribosomal protein L6 n=1 Tax=Nippostrongylus brasiliensis TaxID=27835 RepID=A0A0N4XZC3_NIPBR|nr:unnamed protein product [Nippostrongylus brasiliensis]